MIFVGASGRGLGGIDGVQTVFPDLALVLLVIVTQFGDVLVFVPALTIVLWFGDRDRGAALIGVALGGVGLVLIAKQTLALPRPPTSPPVPIADVPALFRPIYETEVTADGFGFPSGHATAATIVWGSLAWWLDVGTRRRRIVGAAVVVALVALSRVALGVHYVTDVVAGIGLGVAYLVAVAAIRDRFEGDERRFLWLAVALTAVGAAVQAGQDGWLAIGAALGATIAWIATDAPIQPWPATPATIGRSLVVFVAMVGVGGAVGSALQVAGVPVDPALGVTTMITAGLLVAAPGIDSIGTWIESGG